jgi:hypothetical protein
MDDPPLNTLYDWRDILSALESLSLGEETA